MRMLVLAVPLLSCSFLRAVPPPKVYEPPTPLTCTQTRLYPGVDVGLGALMLGATGVAGYQASQAPKVETIAVVVAVAGLAALAGISAATGFTGAAGCDALHARLKQHEYQQFAAQKTMAVGVVGARTDAPVPLDAIDGKPAMVWLHTGGPWFLGSQFSDGWRDVVGAPVSNVVRALTSTEPAVLVRDRLVRPPPGDYRGDEGWQALRWGDIDADIAKSLTIGVRRPLSADSVFASSTATVLGNEAAVRLLLFRGRLAGVEVTPTSGSFSEWESALASKYGGARQTALLERRWETAETFVLLTMQGLSPRITYTSRLWEVMVGPDVERAEQQKANQDL